MMKRSAFALVLACFVGGAASANPPVASYIFPAGGQRGKTVSVKVGGLFLHEACAWEMFGGDGIRISPQLKRTRTLWFEGPLLPLPDSQRQEDYPKDLAGQVEIAGKAATGIRYWRLWTSQGATPAMKFVVGELPEIVEEEIDGDPIPVDVSLPVTVNGRVFPRADVDAWSFSAKKGESIRAEVLAARLGSPLEARLEIVDAGNRRLAESDGAADPILRFTAPADGKYQLRIHDGRFQGGQAFVYRLTLTRSPHVDAVFPLGGRRGSKVRLHLFGQGVPATPVALDLPDSKATDYHAQLSFDGTATNRFPLELDDLPEIVANGTPVKDACTLPAIFNGRIEKPGDANSWPFTARKGEVYEFDLRAGRLGSPLDGVLRLLDSSGKQLAQAEASGPGQLDPGLTFAVPADGVYTVQVQDRFRSRGGPTFAYRLRVDRPAGPDFRLWLQTDAVTVPRNGQAKLKVLVDRVGGFKEPIALSVTGLPEGVTVAAATLNPNQNAIDLSFKADARASIKPAKLVVQGAWKELQRRAQVKVPRSAPQIDSVLFAVALPTPFVIKGEYDMGFAARGSVQKRKYKIERNGFEGPLEVSLTDRQARHLQGVTGPTIIVPAGVSEFTYAAKLPPWMETGRTCRVCVMGVGTIKDHDGAEHRVSFSSVNQNEQLVAVVGPGKLSLELDRTSFTIEPGKSVTIPLRLKRDLDLKDEVKVELIVPSHITGVEASPVTIASDDDRGAIVVRAAADPRGPINMPLTLRATLIHNGNPVFAEAKVDVVPAR